MEKNNGLITLAEAIETYKKEEHAPVNSYHWYRRSARSSGKVHIGNTDIPSFKKGKCWYVEIRAFQEAIKKHGEENAYRKQVTEDLAKGIIHGKPGEVIRTEWGGYAHHGQFRFVWSDYEGYRGKSNGTWYCNVCNQPAKTEYHKQECHRCSDWNGCGKDCTLSAVNCLKCDSKLSI